MVLCGFFCYYSVEFNIYYFLQEGFQSCYWIDEQIPKFGYGGFKRTVSRCRH